MKTAAIILNHNLPDYTDMLYESLKPYERDDYDLMVFDNGSNKDGQSKYTTHGIENNVYFGGGFNAAMQMVLEDENYDSMLFLNNDLTIHPYNFVKVLRDEMFSWFGSDFGDDFPSDDKNSKKYKDYVASRTHIDCDIVSPTFYNIEPKGQCHWKTMHNYGKNCIRHVPFIDFQCPLISKRLLKEIKEIDSLLLYGWGVDCLFAIICQQKKWKMGVTDRLSVLHHNSLTVKRGVAGINMQEYCQKAEQGQREFFAKVGLVNEFNNVRALGEKYDGTT